MPLATRSWIRALALFFPVSLAAGPDEAASAAGDETRCLLESKVAPWLLGGPDAVATPLGGGGAEAAPSDAPILLAFLPAASGAGLDLDPAMFVAAGGEVVRRTPDVVLARVPLGSVLSLAASPSIGFVRPPVRPVLHKVAATRAIGARLWQDGSFFGAGELRLPDPVELRRFQRGRVGEGPTIDIGDAVSILSFLFRDGTLPPCLAAADVDDSGVLDITDGIALLGFLFLGSEPPPAPFDSCCPDLTPDDLGCESTPDCE